MTHIVGLGGPMGAEDVSSVGCARVPGLVTAASAVALAAAGTAGVLGAGLAVAARPPGAGLAETLTLATTIATAAFGAEVVAGGSGRGFEEIRGEATLGLVPLTVTLAALLVAVLVHRRVTRRWTRLRDGLAVAAGSALLVPLLLVPALAARSDNEDLGRGWGTLLSERGLGLRAEVGAAALPAVIAGPGLLLGVLVLSSLTRRAWWPERTRRVRDLLDPAVVGLGVLALLLPLAGAVGGLAVVLGGDDTPREPVEGGARAVAAGGLALLGNAGVWVLGLGGGAPVGARSGRTGADDLGGAERLGGAVTRQEPGLWVAPVVLLVVLAVATLVVVRRARAGQQRAALATWLVGLAVAVPLLVRLASPRLEVRATRGATPYELSGSAGPDLLATTVAVLGVAAVLAALAAFWPRTTPTRRSAGRERPEPRPGAGIGRKQADTRAGR